MTGAEVLESRSPEVLAYTWLHDGKPAGRVRWEGTADPLGGVRVELTRTGPPRKSHSQFTARSGGRHPAAAQW
ncbi:hypothetical protein [Amycolatopsis sp. GA6-003]|uniref:hypothetical protein n=1 Tax=Amycolatopsis sp. GA6-003 TaxID=2652444 RepID=UPI00391715AC